MSITLHPSASKHGINQARIRHVIRNCRCPLYSDAPGDEDLVIFLGPDMNGIPLEVIAVELSGESLRVIHAMKLRRRYTEEYEQVVACQAI
jgi:hypothetical protein